MWNTPTGQRILSGAEARLIQDSIATMVDQLVCSAADCEDCSFHSGIEIFDCLPSSQKLALIEQVARHLLTPTSTPLPLTAVNESVVGAIFENVRQQIEIEIDTERCGLDISTWRDDEEWLDFSPERPTWRVQVLETCQRTLNNQLDSHDADYHGDWPEPDSQEMQDWDRLIESLADRILWDRDYEMADAFLDDAPENAAAKKMMLGIDPDYFTGLAPDPRDEQLEVIVDSIHELTRSKPR